MSTAREADDRREIEAVLYRYCRGLDRADEALLRSVYHDDAVDDRGSFSGPAHEFVTFVLERLQTQYQSTLHTLSNIQCRVDGDEAAVESYVVAYHLRPTAGLSRLSLYGGRYLDTMERRDDGIWRIALRNCVNDFMGEVELHPHEGADQVMKGRRGPEDLSYRLGLT